MHLENFGSYKADNRLVYFDINDFDEAALAPLTWDVIRLATSILVAAPTLGLPKDEAKILCQTFLESYRSALATGKSYWVERDNTTGMVHYLLDSLRHRQRCDFLDRYTVLKEKKRHLMIDGKKALPITPKQRKKIIEWMNFFAEKQSDKKFFQVLDVAKRVAGTGSLGVDRYLLLVHGRGGINGNYLLDLKQSLPSSLVPHVNVPQPQWKTDAERTVTLQRRMQAVSMAFLQSVKIGKQSYVLRALLPTEDRVTLDLTLNSLKEFQALITVMAGLVASAHLRSSGRDGSAIADDLIAFSKKRKWSKQLLTIANDSAMQVEKDWITYCTAYDDGIFAC